MGSLDQLAKSRKRDQHVAELSSGGSLDRIAHQRKGGGAGGIPIVGAPKGDAKKHHRGWLGEVGHVVAQTGVDLKDAAYHLPGGLYEAANAVERDMLTGAKHGHLDPISALVLHGKHTHEIARGQAKLLKQDVQHPLRHPGNTALDALAVFSAGAGTVARAGEVGRVLAAGEGAGGLTRAVIEGPKPPPRVLNVGGLEVRGHYSRAAGSRAMQRLGDKALAKGAEKGVGISVGRRELSAERLQQGRAAKWLGRQERIADATARAPGTRLQVLGQRLKPDELRALRLVAEEVPVERRLGAQEMRKGRATNPKEQARHQERIDLTRAAMEHLTSDAEGRPIFKPEATKLRKVYAQLAAVSHDRESMLKNVGLMDDASLQAAKTNVANVAAGATYEAPTAGKLGKSPSLLAHQKRVASLEGRVTRSQAGGFRTVEDAQARLTKLEREHNTAIDKIAGRLFGPIDRGEVNFRVRENKRAAQQASGVDSLGRASGASGAKATTRGTVKDQMRAEAAKRIEQAIAANPEHPLAARWNARVEEIAQLHQALHPEIFEKVKRRELGRVGKPTDAQRHGQLEGALAVAQRDLASARKSAATRSRPTGFVTAGSRFAHRVEHAGGQLVSEYERRFRNVVSTDNARELSPDYAASNESRARLSAEVHEPSSALAKAVYKRKLARKPSRDRTVTLTAGGTGAGKSSALGGLDLARHEIVYDTNLNNVRTAVEKIDQALASGRDVHIAYVYRDPVESLVNGAIPRAGKAGRTVPLSEHVRTHVGSNEAIRDLVAKYHDDPRVSFRFVDNSRGKNQAQLFHGGVDAIPKLSYSEVDHAVRNAYDKARAAGAVPDHLHAGFTQAGREGLGPEVRGRSEQGRQARPADQVAPLVASPAAIHIGNPVERTKLAGKPRVSSTGSFGHTRKPGSLKAATGGAVEHALERNDVTQIVAERHAEAVRLSKIDRVRTKLAKAGSAVPRRRDDVFVWTDNLTKNERIPAEVRKYLDNPESVAQLPEADRVSLTEKLRQSVFERHDWTADPETRAQFEKIAQDGKGTFVPRKLVGEYAKREVTLPGSHFIDAVNNAQKAGLIYLKVNYPVVQGLSNAAMSIIHQGFAAPVRLKQAVLLDRAIGPELAHVVDDIMGQGAVVQAQFEGQGVIARGSQKLAHAMSSKVDTPARRAAFLHEADKAGYGTKAKFEQLLTDDKLAGDLGEVAQRAKEAIVDYGDLGPNERAIIRRLVFVYPWQKGATKYAAHFLRDHPVQAAVLGHVGEQGKQASDRQLGPVPSYLQGVFDAGGGLVNPSGLNFFQTPAQIGEGVAGLVSGNPASPSGQDFLAPLPGMLVAALTRQDSIGRPLPRNPAAAVRDLTIGQTPAAALARAALAQHSDIARKLFGSRTSSKTFPNPDDPYWRFLVGGLYPRDYSRPALNRNAAREKAGR